jgi:predicted phage terminase large subunit-like protein
MAEEYGVFEYDSDLGIESEVQEERDPALDAAACNLASFACMVDPSYEPAKYHLLICRELMRCMTGETKRLIIEAPPQHGKSRTATEIFPAFFYGNFPDQALIVGGYGQEKANDFGRATKKIMDSEEYAAIFPDTQISDTSDAIHRFATTRGGTYFCVGIGGAVTGRGANGLIFDDPYKNREEADSDTRTQVIIDWWKSTFRTRLRGDGFIVLIQTRWNKRDLIQWLLDNEDSRDPDDPDTKKYKWRIIKLKAVIEDEKDAAEDPLKRKVGDVLWPEVFPAPVMKQMKHDVGLRDWNALYQQEPSDVQGEIFLRKNWNYWCRANCNAAHEHHPLPTKFDKMMQVWDCTFKDASTSDFVVGGVVKKSGPNLYVIDTVRKKATARGTCDLIRAMLKKHPEVIKIGIEDKANGPEVISTMKQEVSGVVEIPANGSKDSRANAASVHQESGNIYLPYDAVWKEELVEECAAFPNGKHDDYVDFISHAILQTLGNRLEGMLDWMKEQVNKLGNKKAA